jgi:hypothetical protein
MVTVSIATGGCLSQATSVSGSIMIHRAIEDGYTPVQTLRVNVDAGYMTGDFFKLTYGSQKTTCIQFGESASNVASKLNSVSGLTDQINLPAYCYSSIQVL